MASRIRIGYLALAACGLSAQTLQLSSGSASPGQKVTLEISLSSPAGKEPLGLQWETNFPATQLLIPGESPIVGTAAASAGKTIRCAGPGKKSQPHIYRCILFGAQKPIGNGAIATLEFTVAANARPGPKRISLDKAAAVSADLKKVPLKKVEGTITVTR